MRLWLNGEILDNSAAFVKHVFLHVPSRLFNDPNMRQPNGQVFMHIRIIFILFSAGPVQASPSQTTRNFVVVTQFKIQNYVTMPAPQVTILFAMLRDVFTSLLINGNGVNK